MIEVLFTEGDFSLIKESGIGRNETEWEGLSVRSDGLAKDHVVEIRLESAIGLPSYDGTPIKYKYNPEGTHIAHGMRMSTDTFKDTEKYIAVLQEALAFAKRVNKYIIDNGWTR